MLAIKEGVKTARHALQSAPGPRTLSCLFGSDTMWSGVRNVEGLHLRVASLCRLQSNQANEPRLFLQDGQDLIAQFVLEFFLSFRFHVAFHNACKHRGNSFRIFLEGDVFPARRYGGSKISLRGGESCCGLSDVQLKL